MEQRYSSKGRWLIERERCHIADSAPPPHEHAEPIAHIIPLVMGMISMTDVNLLDDIAREWASLAGPQVAAHTRPGKLARKRLTIFADSPAWLSEIVRFRRADLLMALQRRFGPDNIKILSIEPDPDR